jgi:hypothetical protein
MTWWFHLLVRRVEKLRDRCDVLERVTRAVGRVGYADRAEPLLVYTITSYTRVITLSISRNSHSVCDKPCICFPDGDRGWRRDGVFHRIGGPAEIFMYHDYQTNTDVVMEEWWLQDVKVRSQELLFPDRYFSEDRL